MLKNKYFYFLIKSLNAVLFLALLVGYISDFLVFGQSYVVLVR